MIREIRYEVLKVKDIEGALTETERLILASLSTRVANYRKERGKEPLECVVVESDWPEYKRTWDAIESRVDTEYLYNKIAEIAGDPEVVAGLPYFYIADDKLVCSNAPSPQRLTQYTGYEYVILARKGSKRNGQKLDRWNTFMLVGSRSTYRISDETVLTYIDNLDQLFDDFYNNCLNIPITIG